MAREIIDLEKSRSTSARLYNRTQEIVDSQTGEVKNDSNEFFTKRTVKRCLYKGIC